MSKHQLVTMVFYKPQGCHGCGHKSLLAWLCCSAHVSNNTQGVFFDQRPTKFIFSSQGQPLHSNITHQILLGSKTKVVYRCIWLCSICTQLVFYAVRASKWRYWCATDPYFRGNWWHWDKNSLLATYVQNNRSTCANDWFGLICHFGP